MLSSAHLSTPKGGGPLTGDGVAEVGGMEMKETPGIASEHLIRVVGAPEGLSDKESVSYPYTVPLGLAPESHWQPRGPRKCTRPA